MQPKTFGRVDPDDVNVNGRMLPPCSGSNSNMSGLAPTTLGGFVDAWADTDHLVQTHHDITDTRTRRC